MTIALATTHHDPHNLLGAQTARIAPRLREWYAHLVMLASPVTHPASLTILRDMGAHIAVEDADDAEAFLHLGRKRRHIVEAAMHLADDITHVHLCDFDRVLHWAEFYPDELRATHAHMQQNDFTVLGRTPRAFASHPRVQRDTEAIINHAFALASGKAWDVTAASRGLSRRAADAISAQCSDDTIGNDCSWPLFLARRAGFTFGYLEVDGLEFETADRYADEIATGGLAAWLARMDNDPQHWAQRLDLARVEVESIVRWSDGRVA